MNGQAKFKFLRDAQAAIASAMQTNTVLVVYATDEENRGEWLQSWVHPRLMGNENVEKKTTWLMIVKGTPEFQQLQELFPHIQTQSLYFIKNQQIELVITGDSGSGKFSHWNRIIDYLENVDCGAGSHSNSHVHNTQRDVMQSQNAETPQAKDTGNAAVETSASPIGNKKTFKEEVNDLTKKKHREEVLKQKKLERLERQRILRLVEADKQERQKKKLQEAIDKKYQQEENNSDEVIITVETPDINDNIKKTDKLDKTKTCTLQIRLTNGQSIVNEFDADIALSEVRTWVNENRTDNKCFYLFHRNVPRVTFSLEDEEKSLRNLELIPRSALILEHIDNSADESQPGLLARITNRLAFWRDVPQNDTTSSANYVSPIEEKDQNSISSKKEESSGSNKNSSKCGSPGFPYVTQLNTVESDINLPERTASPNIHGFSNDDEHKSDEDRPSYNGNNINLEPKKDD